jgi:hypothetical protein
VKFKAGMLSKEVCKRCVNSRRIVAGYRPEDKDAPAPWGEWDDDAWSDGHVSCPGKSGELLHTWTHWEAHLSCPYRLEHLMAEQK